MKIEGLTVTDAELICREGGLLHSFWDEHEYSTVGDFVSDQAFAALAHFVAADDTLTIGAFDNDAPIGLLALMSHRSFWGTTRLGSEVLWYVTPARRGEGIGRDLMQHGTAWAREKGVQLIQAHADGRQIFVRVH